MWYENGTALTTFPRATSSARCVGGAVEDNTRCSPYSPLSSAVPSPEQRVGAKCNSVGFVRALHSPLSLKAKGTKKSRHRLMSMWK